MSLLTKSKKEIVASFAQSKTDTGSVEVQCALMTGQIESLTEHLKIHKKDFSSRRGLLILVGKRRSLLDYLKANSVQRYEDLYQKIGNQKINPIFKKLINQKLKICSML